jgi:hypothetical protein
MGVNDMDKLTSQEFSLERNKVNLFFVVVETVHIKTQESYITYKIQVNYHSEKVTTRDNACS